MVVNEVMDSKVDKITISEYEPSDRNGCLALLQRTFPGSSNESTFAWRFENNYCRKPLILCARNKHEVVSFNSWIPWVFTYKGQTYIGFQSGESATDISYRGRGLLTELLKHGFRVAAERGIDFLYGFPSKMSYGVFYKAGYYPISIHYSYVRPVNPFHWGIDRPSHGDLHAVPVLGLTQYDRITPIFDDNYYNWRYVENPTDYSVVGYEKYNCSANFFVRKNKWKGLTELWLMDVQFNTYNQMFLKDALNFVDKIFSRQAICMRTLLNEFSDRGQALMQHFPIKLKSKHHVLVVRPVSKRPDIQALLNRNCWDIMPHCVDYL
jgi:hypothetical protein